MNRSSRRLPILLTMGLAAITLTLTGCPKGGLPGMGGGSGGVDPNSCGNISTNDTGRKLHAFLEATANLNTTVMETEKVVKQSCIIMGNELGMAAGDLEGETKSVCTKVINTINENLKVLIKADAKLDVEYTPAVCTVDIQATAKAAAECDARAEADIEVKCEGSCTGTCEGKCDGKCEGAAGTVGAAGECNGTCKGTCEGSCSGGCDGSADVNASAECKASAEVKASVDVKCTEPELKINAEASAMIDTGKAEMTIKALRAGLPKLLSVKARLKPLQAAIKVWAKSAKNLAGEAGQIASSFKEQAMCISGQIAAAAGMVANINASVEVSVSVSVEASGSAGVN